MAQELLPTSDLNVYKTQTTQLLESATALTVTTVKDTELAADILHTLKGIKKVVLDRKEEITRPLMDSLASVRDLFKPFEKAFLDAERTVKDKLLMFQRAEDERIEKEKARIAARVDKGTMKGETAITKLENLGEVPATAQGSVGTVRTRSITKVRITDESLIPRMYLVPDMQKITTAVIQGGVAIPGVETYKEKVMASY